MKTTNISESQVKKNGTVKPKSEGSDNKIRFPLWIYPETMDKVDAMFESDNCRSKSEFIEKAIKFYTGYLLQERNVNYLAPRITSAVDAIVHGSEARINRNLFKIAVELGKLAHTIAAANEVSEDTLNALHRMCVDEVSHINGVINFRDAVRFQNDEWED